MKKVFLIIAIMLFFVPFVTYADVGATYHTSVFDNNGNVGYIVKYTTPFGATKDVARTSYITYDPTVLEYYSVEEVNSYTEAYYESEIKVNLIEKGKLELTIKPIKDFDEYDMKVLITFKFRDKKISTKLELTPECFEKCDTFFTGDIENQDKVRAIELSSDGTIVKNGDEADIIINDESEDLTNNPSEDDESLEKANTEDYKQTNYITIIGILSCIIIALIILLICLTKKSKKITAS